jgi:tRNA-dihydrouridine synthase B
MYTEFVNAEGIIRNSEKAKRKLLFLEEERIFGIQLYGGSEVSMESAAHAVEEMEPDLIDINCGCWVKNVVGQGAGSALLRDLSQMERVISSVVRAVRLPVTVKTRLGWDSRSVNILEIARVVENAGAKALTIHCRTREQAHKGDPDYSWIAAVKNAVSIPIIVNGGINSARDAKYVFDSTGCNGIMIARGAIQNPWIFREIKYFLQTGNELVPPTLFDRIHLLLEHLSLSVKFKGERNGVIEFRKHYSGYLRDHPEISKLRMNLMQFSAEQQIVDCLQTFMEKAGLREVTRGSAAA